jgi:L-alanine-DL-glutamate epimerase-like enolase superfamily enzyme
MLRVEQVDLTFLNLPMVRPEGWLWGGRSSYTVGLVELHTDAGITGIGEVNVCMGPDPTVIRAMTDQMAKCIVGESALAPQRFLTRVMGLGWFPFHRAAALVLGGIEMACWDAAGKHLGQPVSMFFGGSLRDSFASMYYVQTQDDVEDMIDQGREAVQRGFETIYFKVGIDERRDVELVARMREAIGPGPRLRVDANEAWSPGTAVRILRQMAPHVIEYIEQPVSMFDIDGLAHVRAASGVAVGANQTSWGQHAVLEIVRKNAADVIMTDPHQEGGLIPLKRVLGLCEMACLPFVVHAFNATTISLLADLHVLSTSTAPILAQQGHPDFLADDYVTEPISYAGGRMQVPTNPGIGLDIDREKLSDYHARFEREGMASIYPTTNEAPPLFVPTY